MLRPGRLTSKQRRHVAALIIGVMIPASFAWYVGSCLNSLLVFADYLNESAPVDYGSLIMANETRLAEMATEFEFYLQRDNLPLNYTLTAYWEDTNYTSIAGWGTSGDAAIWTGMTLAMAALRYASIKQEGNASRTAGAIDLVRRLASGVGLLLAVPNGGIGPDYPGVLARSVSPKNWSIAHPGISGFDYVNGADGVDVFDGAGAYSDWLWIGYPSLDQYSGIIMGISCAAALVGDDDPWVDALMALLSAQIIEHFRKTNWNLVDGNARTTGQSFQWMPEHTSYWVLATVFMGVLTDPVKYTPLYHHWAYDRGYADYKMLDIDLGYFSLFNYFSMNINWVIFYAMATFETDPSLKCLYTRVMENCLYQVASNHRNAWFNMAYLHVTGKDDPNIRADVLDQLMRFDVERVPGDPASRRIPERGLNETGNRFEGLIPSNWPVVEFPGWLDANPVYPARQVNVAAYFTDSEYLAVPKTAEQYQCVDFLWQRSPWERNTYSPALRQDSGLAFLLPYYMAKFNHTEAVNE